MDFPTPKPKNHFSDDPLMPLTLSHRSPHLLTNCDLPPPLQLFTPLFFDDETPSVLRALRLSQSRAREAEERVELTAAKNARLASMLLDESLRISAHRRWVMMLESEVSALNKRLSQAAKEDGDGAADFAWCIALALCLGIAGVGFALGRFLF
ncbi:hypothetical protein M5K25_023110 [Dendrobium thyrsiflorum]